jgi:pyridinium-3,5-biscarboxylic acid mononucleotide sulfurtransferase
MDLEGKLDRLRDRLRRLESAAVAFSGGVDSSFLLAVCREVLGERVTAFTVDTLLIARAELSAAARIAAEIGVDHRFLVVNLTGDSLLDNPRHRCYLCKHKLFGQIRQEATAMELKGRLDGSNLDDLEDDRPGMKAVAELGFLSPLIETGFTKAEIRAASRRLGLSSWDLPSQACLASRISYGEPITPEKLAAIEQAEVRLKEIGLIQVRVRHHGRIARVEVAPDERPRFGDGDFCDRVTAELKACGFEHVTLDLGGYRTGHLRPQPSTLTRS